MSKEFIKEFFAVEIKTRLVGDFSKYGMELADFYLNSITPPPEVQKMIDERSGLEAVGNLDSFLKFKAAKALGDAAAAGGDGAGSAAAGGMGIGMGAGLGFMIPGMIAQSMKGQGQGVAVKEMLECPKCRAQISADERFCSACGAPIAPAAKCPGCQAEMKPGAKFCANCGRKVEG